MSLPSSSVPLVTSSLTLVLPPSAPNELPSFGSHSSVNILEPELATVPMNFITLDVHPLPFPSVKAFARVIVINELSPPPDLYDSKLPLGWKARFGEPYQLGTVTSSMIAIHSYRRRYRDADGNKIIVSVNSRDEALPSTSVFKYAVAFFDRLMFGD